MGASSRAWYRNETDREVVSLIDSDIVRHLSRHEPHKLAWVILVISFKDLVIEGCEVFVVEIARHEEEWLPGRIGRGWLVHRIEANNIVIVSKTS